MFRLRRRYIELIWISGIPKQLQFAHISIFGRSCTQPGQHNNLNRIMPSSSEKNTSPTYSNEVRALFPLRNVCLWYLILLDFILCFFIRFIVAVDALQHCILHFLIFLCSLFCNLSEKQSKRPDKIVVYSYFSHIFLSTQFVTDVGKCQKSLKCFLTLMLNILQEITIS